MIFVVVGVGVVVVVLTSHNNKKTSCVAIFTIRLNFLFYLRVPHLIYTIAAMNRILKRTFGLVWSVSFSFS